MLEVRLLIASVWFDCWNIQMTAIARQLSRETGRTTGFIYNSFILFWFHGLLRLSLSAVENLRAHGEGPVKRSKNQNCLTGDNRSNGTSKKVGQKTAVTRLLPTGFLHDISLPVDISRASTAKEGVFYFATPGGIFTRRTVNQAILKPKDGKFY